MAGCLQSKVRGDGTHFCIPRQGVEVTKIWCMVSRTQLIICHTQWYQLSTVPGPGVCFWTCSKVATEFRQVLCKETFLFLSFFFLICPFGAYLYILLELPWFLHWKTQWTIDHLFHIIPDFLGIYDPILVVFFPGYGHSLLSLSP